MDGSVIAGCVICRRTGRRRASADERVQVCVDCASRLHHLLQGRSEDAVEAMLALAEHAEPEPEDLGEQLGVDVTRALERDSEATARVLQRLEEEAETLEAIAVAWAGLDVSGRALVEACRAIACAEDVGDLSLALRVLSEHLSGPRAARVRAALYPE
jgi:hypothetical protein